MATFLKIISGNDIKHGSAVTFTNQRGDSEILSPGVSLNGIHHSGVIEDRMDVYRFYSGDESGLQSTATYTVAASADDGKASTAYKSSSSNST